MLTNVETGDALLTEAMAVAGLPTKRETVEEALRSLIMANHRRRAIAEMAGLGWDGDLDSMRGGRTHELDPSP